MVVNVGVKVAMAESGLRGYEVAEALGISESKFSVMLRKELSETDKAWVLDAIRAITDERGGAENVSDTK